MDKSTKAAYFEPMHPRNKHHDRYDFEALTKTSPELSSFVIKNPKGGDSIEFSNPLAVKSLNRAILKHYYHVQYWDIPQGFLCTPIPGRADYIHTVSDLLNGKARVLDIGVGANCVYPLIGHAEYDWSFVGTDIDPKALSSARKIVEENNLEEVIELRMQNNNESIFKDIIKAGEKFDLSICNPPFHESLAAASEGTSRKWRNLGKKDLGLNFGGQGGELWCAGGEKTFIRKMIEESEEFKNQIEWFTTLVSKESNLPVLLKILQKTRPKKSQVIEMIMGQKKSRILAWSYQ